MDGPTITTSPDTEVLDILRAVYPKVIKKGFTVICQQYPDYFVAGLLASGASVGEAASTFEWAVMYKRGSSAKWTPWAQADELNVENVTRKASDSMVHITWNVSWLRQEILVARNNPSKLYDVIDTRYAAEQLNVADELEAKCWTAPTTTIQAETLPKGFPWWIQKMPSGGTVNGAFQGGNPTGFTNGRGNIDTSTYTDWENWSAQYTDITQADMLDKLRRMLHKTHFTAPPLVAGKVPAYTPIRRRLLMNLETRLKWQKIHRDSNENMGLDVGGPVPTFERHALEVVDYLENDASNPIYALDMTDMKIHYLQGDFLHETGPMAIQNPHNMFGVFWDLTFQVVPTNLQRHGVIATAD